MLTGLGRPSPENVKQVLVLALVLALALALGLALGLALALVPVGGLVKDSYEPLKRSLRAS